MKRLLAGLVSLCLSAVPASAGELARQGFGLLVTNDAIGDGRDRWRTGSVASSHVWSSGWTGAPPPAFGDLIELRIGGEVLAPESMVGPAPSDRRYAQALSLGLHTHLKPGQVDFTIGADLVLTGPMTGLDHVQKAVHSVFGGQALSPAVEAAQIGDDANPTLVFEAGRDFALGPGARLRPFLEVRAGVETLVRAGADVTLGRFGRGGLLIRAPVTGHRYNVIEEAAYRGVSLMMGGDVAHVARSEFLPAGGAARPSGSRARLRAGLHWRSRAGSSAFYGVTWLGREFATQRTEQIVGSLQLRLKF